MLLDWDDVVGLEVDDRLGPGPAAVAVAQVVVAEDDGVLVGGQEPGQVAVVLVQVLWVWRDLTPAPSEYLID